LIWTGDSYDGVGPSDRLFSRQYVNNNEDLILSMYQTPLKSKYNLNM